ncbi:MAG TPA: conjugal transfer protein TraS [Caldimonas sp.]|nr:conjugal transfer protein TraS [Caldimonas sp.]
MSPHDIDGVLVQWGERLFYPRNRIVRAASTPRLGGSVGQRAAAIRQRIQATVVRRAPQVMVKVTGGGRGMAAIAAHFRYISKSGRLAFEDDRGVVREGKEALRDLAEQWRHGGSFIDETSHRREAFNIMLSMPSGTDPLVVQHAAREFARAELGDHRYVMVLHDHQANPHVHISVRAESREGWRLNPRKADLQRWRETFAEKLRGWGIDAEATRQRTRGQWRHYEPLWRVKAAQEGRLETPLRTRKSGDGIDRDRAVAAEAWSRIAEGLSRSDNAEDKALAEQVDRFLGSTFAVAPKRRLDKEPEPQLRTKTVRQPLREPLRESPRIIARNRDGPDRGR